MLLNFGQDWETKLLTTSGFWNISGLFSAAVEFTQYLDHIPAWKNVFHSPTTHFATSVKLTFSTCTMYLCIYIFFMNAQCIHKDMLYFMSPSDVNTGQNALHTHDGILFHMLFFIYLKGNPRCPVHTLTVLPHMLLRYLHRCKGYHFLQRPVCLRANNTRE